MKQENVSQLLDTIGDLVERLPLEEIERTASADSGASFNSNVDLLFYVRLVWRWLWLLIFCAIISGVIAFLVSNSTTPIYRATSTWRVDEARGPAVEMSDLVLGERTAQTYARMMTYTPVLAGAAERLDLDPSVLNNEVTLISISPVRDTQLLNVSIEGISPSLIVLMANTLPQIFREQLAEEQSLRFAESKTSLQSQMDTIDREVQRLQLQIGNLDTAGSAARELEMAQLQNSLSLYQSQFATLLSKFEEIRLEESRAAANIVIANPATLPGSPIRPRILTNTLMGAVIGALLALGVVFLVSYLDTSVTSPHDVRRVINAPFLGAVALFSGKQSKVGGNQLITITEPRNPITESYRGVRTNLQFASVDKNVRSLVVTSALPGEGKTTTASNLAVVMAQSGMSVALIDADLRKPSLHNVFNINRRPGIIDALLDEGSGGLRFSPNRIVPNLFITPCGQRPPNPAELLGSTRMKTIVEKLLESVDLVIFDAPPLMAVTDALVLSGLVDGVLMVVGHRSDRRAVARASESLHQVGANILGFVMNRMTKADGGDYYYYYDYYYGDDDASEANGTGPAPFQNGNGAYEAMVQHTTTIRPAYSKERDEMLN